MNARTNWPAGSQTNRSLAPINEFFRVLRPLPIETGTLIKQSKLSSVLRYARAVIERPCISISPSPPRPLCGLMPSPLYQSFLLGGGGGRGEKNKYHMPPVVSRSWASVNCVAAFSWVSLSLLCFGASMRLSPCSEGQFEQGTKCNSRAEPSSLSLGDSPTNGNVIARGESDG